jgi:AcrR family transcriptional regulator
MVEVACERGLESTSVARVLARSGVSRRTFYELFEDRYDCFLAAFEQAVAQVAGRVIPAYEAESNAVDAIRAGLLALLSFFDEEPELGWLCVVESLAGDPATLVHRKQVLQRVAAVLDAGWGLTRNPPPRFTAEGVLGGVFAVIHARLLDASSPALVGLLNPLMAMIVLPYLGPAAARRERARRAPKLSPTRRSPMPASDPLQGPRMRLTYRTLRALAAIAEDPGSSNREVAAAAGISDQGQVSKLLRRLKDLGLVRNTGQGQCAGMANAWTITAKGQALVRAVRLSSEQPRSLR